MTMIGDNSLASLEAMYAAMRQRTTELVASARAVKSCGDGNAGDVLLLFKMLKTQAAAVEEARTANKAPYLQAGRTVDTFFKLYADELTVSIDKVERLLGAYMALLEPGEDGKVHLRDDYGNTAFFIEREVWDITDENAIPREYLTVDRAKVNTAVKSGIAVPGITPATDRKVSIR